MWPDWELNFQPFVYGTKLPPTEPHWPGQNLDLLQGGTTAPKSNWQNNSQAGKVLDINI